MSSTEYNNCNKIMITKRLPNLSMSCKFQRFHRTDFTFCAYEINILKCTRNDCLGAQTA